MKKQLSLIFFFLMLLLPLNIYSVELNIQGEIKEYSLSYSENISIKLNCDEDLSLNLPLDSYDISFNGNTLDNRSVFVNDCSKVNSISYNLDKLENLGSSKFRLERNFNNIEDLNYTYEILYPLEYKIDVNNSFPKNYSLNFYDTYKSISFSKNNFFLLYFEKKNLENTSFTLFHLGDELNESEVWVLIIITFILGGLSTYIYMKKESKKFKLESVPSYVLSKDEKLIFEIVKKNPGINQKQIGSKINYSKAKVSIIINELDQKKLIKREKFGRSFKVYVQKKII